MKKIYKRAVLIIVLVCITAFCFGCVKIHNTDTEFFKKAYLDYSLGQHTITKNIYSKTHSPIPAVDKGYEWAAEYKDADGSQVFIFNNVYDFNEQVYSYAKDITTSKLEQQFVKSYFDEYNDVKIETSAKYKNNEQEYEYFIKKVSNALGGIKLSSITPKEMSQMWETEYLFYCYASKKSNEDIEKLKVHIKEMMTEIFNYFQDESIVFTLNGKDTNNSFVLKWDAASNASKWYNLGKELDKENTKNGRLTVIRNLSVNDSIIADADITFSETTGEYHINEYYIRQTLDALNIPIEKIDESVGQYRWKIGNDVFEITKSHGILLKNGRQIMEFNGAKGINLSVFEEITGTKAVCNQAESTCYVTVTA